jgi:CheY-like chemotaxis protein
MKMHQGSILVVDDDIAVRTGLVNLLEDEGYIAQGVSNGKTALDLIRTQPSSFSLIVLDLMMPDMNGWQFRLEQWRDPSIAHIPVIVLSADINVKARGLPINIPPAVYLQKPVEADALLTLVSQYASKL